jgi:hypothetical protein
MHRLAVFMPHEGSRLIADRVAGTEQTDENVEILSSAGGGADAQGFVEATEREQRPRREG